MLLKSWAQGTSLFMSIESYQGCPAIPNGNQSTVARRPGRKGVRGVAKVWFHLEREDWKVQYWNSWRGKTLIWSGKLEEWWIEELEAEAADGGLAVISVEDLGICGMSAVKISPNIHWNWYIKTLQTGIQANNRKHKYRCKKSTATTRRVYSTACTVSDATRQEEQYH